MRNRPEINPEPADKQNRNRNRQPTRTGKQTGTETETGKQTGTGTGTGIGRRGIRRSSGTGYRKRLDADERKVEIMQLKLECMKK